MMHSCRSANTFECKYKYELFVQQSGSYWFEYFIGVGGMWPNPRLLKNASRATNNLEAVQSISYQLNS
jgi:hypothetical protein